MGTTGSSWRCAQFGWGVSLVGEDGNAPSLTPYQDVVLLLNYSPLVSPENYDISTFCLRGRCSSSELRAVGAPSRTRT
jgi:hypothetical protein